MGQLTGVHGIGKQYLGRHQLLERWTPALADALERATGHHVRRPDLDLAFYGHLFRPTAPNETAKGPVGEDAAELANVDAEELAELTEAVEEMVTPADLADAATRVDKGLWLPAPLQVLVGAIERRFPPASGILHLGVLRQVRRYLREEDLKAQVDRITAETTADAVAVIGHSLGSVVAYEFLRQHPGHPAKLLLTLGSPLGLRMVRRRLPVGGLAVDRWVDVRDRNDPVTAAGALGRWYPGVVEQPVENGADAHAAERYLDCRAVGDALITALPELGR